MYTDILKCITLYEIDEFTVLKAMDTGISEVPLLMLESPLLLLTVLNCSPKKSSKVYPSWVLCYYREKLECLE